MAHRFMLTPGRCVLVLHGPGADLTAHKCDAIVNAANERMLGGGGVDGMIHRRAGPELLEHCRTVPEASPGVRCPTGSAVITPGFKLPAAHVIHTVGPVYAGRESSEPLLRSAYRSSVQKALEANLKTIAFPAISCGVFGYPFDEAAAASLNELSSCADGLSEVAFCLFDKGAADAYIQEAEKRFERAADQDA